jgi:hypothetical protein
MMSIVSSVAGGVARVGGAAASAGGAALSSAANAGANVDNAMDALGLDANDLVAPVNERLQREGKPPITAEQLERTLKAVAQKGVREGRLDREMLVQELARNTALSRADAEDIANDIQARYEQASQRIGGAIDRAGDRATDIALQAADKTGKAMLAIGVMMLLSLGAAIGGGALGVPRIARADVGPAARTDVPPSTLTPAGTVRDVDRDPLGP